MAVLPAETLHRCLHVFFSRSSDCEDHAGFYLQPYFSSLVKMLRILGIRFSGCFSPAQPRAVCFTIIALAAQRILALLSH
jgi:hypothetical protein